MRSAELLLSARINLCLILVTKERCAVQNTKISVPPAYVRNHPSQTAAMDPDDAAAMLLMELAKKTGKKLPDIDLLDVGCGTRFAVGIYNGGIPIKSYTGIDIDERLIKWLKSNVADERMEFVHWPVRNPVYNPSGLEMREFPSLPISRVFDVISFFSVFTHLDPSDAKKMLEFCRPRLKLDGRVFLTAFVIDELDGYEEGNPDRPSLVSRFGRRLFETIVSEEGFVIEASHPKQKLMAPHFVLSRK